MKDSRKKSHRHDKAVKTAYNLLVSYRKLMEEKGEPYKVELIDDLPEDAFRQCGPIEDVVEKAKKMTSK